jgi:hypothetical protein
MKHEIEIWLSVDSEGTAAVSVESADDARESSPITRAAAISAPSG